MFLRRRDKQKVLIAKSSRRTNDYYCSNYSSMALHRLFSSDLLLFQYTIPYTRRPSWLHWEYKNSTQNKYNTVIIVWVFSCTFTFISLLHYEKFFSYCEINELKTFHIIITTVFTNHGLLLFLKGLECRKSLNDFGENAPLWATVYHCTENTNDVWV